jgi:hypothetical protein
MNNCLRGKGWTLHARSESSPNMVSSLPRGAQCTYPANCGPGLTCVKGTCAPY